MQVARPRPRCDGQHEHHDGSPTDNEQAKPADAGKTTTGAADAGTKDDAEVIDPANAVVLARDGKHTIPYDRLEKARQGEQHCKAQAEEAQRQLTDLRAKADARAEAGQAPTKTGNMVAAAEAAIERAWTEACSAISRKRRSLLAAV